MNDLCESCQTIQFQCTLFMKLQNICHRDVTTVTIMDEGDKIDEFTIVWSVGTSRQRGILRL